ncbi:RNA polymerase sigma70 [Paenibacillus beijingensis]|uniref:RNA polymerase sigma factor n=1 Tax=Paenibacillus beijingensis TaxID=1126833 RepID=A0A0D5NQS3_9BACL|nr:RNA polymerase sigma70 [Paenibacillus beijingensis]
MKAETLWEAHHEHIRRFVDHKTHFHPDAEDIVQNVFMKAFARVDDVKDDLKIRAWLYQIARNCIVDHYRKQKRTGELPDQLCFSDEYEEPDLTEEAVAGLKNVIRLLPDKYREALELSELSEMSQKELSEHLGISYSGAKSRVQRGRKMIKDMMTSCCAIEADRYGNIIDYRVMQEEPRLKRS